MGFVIGCLIGSNLWCVLYALSLGKGVSDLQQEANRLRRDLEDARHKADMAYREACISSERWRVEDSKAKEALKTWNVGVYR